MLTSLKKCFFVLTAGTAFFVGCKPPAEPASEPRNSEPAAQAEQAPESAEALPEPAAVSRTVDAWTSLGAKFGLNKDGTLKSADFSGVGEIPAFEADEADRYRTLRVLRGKGTLPDELVSQAAESPELTECLWVETEVSDKALETLSTVPNLKKLRLNGLQMTPDTPLILAKFPAVAELDLSGSNLADDAIPALTGIVSLAKLNLYQTQVGDAGVEALLPLAEKLEWLNLDDTQITDAAGSTLAQMKNLKFLHIGRTKTTDALIGSLASLTQLEKIHVTRTGITEEGAGRLREALPNTEVISEVQE